MRRSTHCAAVVLTAVACLTTPASAAGNGCANGFVTVPPTGTVPTPFFTVTGALGTLAPAGCPGGSTLATAGATCVWATSPGDFVVAGAYCGPTVGAGSSIDCVYDPLGPVALNTRLVLGFDVDLDGNIALGEWVSSPVNGGVTVTNPYAGSARVIGYPVSITGSTFPADRFILRCG